MLSPDNISILFDLLLTRRVQRTHTHTSGRKEMELYFVLIPTQSTEHMRRTRTISTMHCSRARARARTSLSWIYVQFRLKWISSQHCSCSIFNVHVCAPVAFPLSLLFIIIIIIIILCCGCVLNVYMLYMRLQVKCFSDLTLWQCVTAWHLRHSMQNTCDSLFPNMKIECVLFGANDTYPHSSTISIFSEMWFQRH